MTMYPEPSLIVCLPVRGSSRRSCPTESSKKKSKDNGQVAGTARAHPVSEGYINVDSTL